MDRVEYENKRVLLVNERITLMDILEIQMDFPEDDTLAEYEKNKREIIDLDDSWKRHMREARKKAGLKLNLIPFSKDV